MASLIRRYNGIYYVVSCTKGARTWLSLHTRDEVEASFAFNEYNEGQRKKRVLSMSAFSEDFLSKVHLNVAETTVSIYRAAFSNFIRLCGDRPIRSVTPLDVERFKVNRAREVKPVTVNIDLRTLRAAFNEALRLKLIDESPFEGVKLARVEEKEAVFLTEKEIQRLLMTIDDPEFKHLVLFAILTMVRLGELVHLEWDDIDMVRREIHIRNKKGFRVKGGKRRTIPMNNWVHEFLVHKNVKSGYVFKNARGYPLIGGSVSHRFKKYVRRAELDGAIHFHSLRHTGISLLVNRGVPQVFVQRLAGHSSLLTTQIYTHTEDRNLISAMNAFPRLN